MAWTQATAAANVVLRSGETWMTARETYRRRHDGGESIGTAMADLFAAEDALVAALTAYKAAAAIEHVQQPRHPGTPDHGLCSTCGGTKMVACAGPKGGCWGMHMGHPCPDCGDG